MAQFPHEPVGGSLQRRPGHDRRDGDRVGTTGTQRVGDSRHRQQGADGHDRVGRSDHHHVGAGQGIEHSRPRARVLGAVEAHRVHSHGVPQPDEVLLEADLPAGFPAGSATVGQRHHGGHRILGHRQQGHLQPPRCGDFGGDCGQPGAFGQAAGPVEVGAEVAVAQAEPGGATEPVQGVHGLPRLAGQPPAGLRVPGLGQRVGDGVQVGRDVQAVQDHVVGRVHDRRDLGGRHGADHAPQQSGGPHATGQDGDHVLALITMPVPSRSGPVKSSAGGDVRPGPCRRPPSSRPAR